MGRFASKNKKRRGRPRKEKALLEEELLEPQPMLSRETASLILGICFFSFALLLLLASIDRAGVVGRLFYQSLEHILGYGYFLAPLSLIALGVLLIKRGEEEKIGIKIFGLSLFFLSGISLIDLTAHRGGMVGSTIAGPLTNLFDVYASFILVTALFLISLSILLDRRVSFATLASKATSLVRKSPRDTDEQDDIEIIGLAPESIESETIDTDEPITTENDTPSIEQEKSSTSQDRKHETVIDFGTQTDRAGALTNESMFKTFPEPPTGYAYTPPPISLLKFDKGKPGVGDIKANANTIKRTLHNFNITVEVEEITIGPSITRYALKPAEGVKLSRIVGLQNDLALALAAHPVRVEAPIPGRSLVGIEIPNTSKTTVGLASLLSADEFQKAEKPLFISLGRSINGKSHFANLAKMPHALIAGATGSGKSVTIHTVIASLLYRNSPENLRLIMIDPKRVELTLYNNIPHLLTPVITSAKETILALKWAAKEMDRRYDILETEHVRDIDSYHKNIYIPAHKKYERSKKSTAKNTGATEHMSSTEEVSLPERMPYIVIVIDELADIMQTYPRELESSIVRIAQMSRAVGIHLVLSTQRPSVNVITGLIKANIPARIALQVSSQIDSRTILDTGGAEKLLGAGDMLYLSGEMSKPVRLQSAFISEGEVKEIVKYLRKNYGDAGIDNFHFSTTGDNDSGKNSLFESIKNNNSEDEDPLYEEARELVVHSGKASTSYLQRKLRVGYSRAARIMDILEEHGVIGTSQGSKPREVLEGVSATGETEKAISENP